MAHKYKCLPNDILADGTEITVINRGKGVVVSSRVTKDQHGKDITVHRVRVNGKEFDCNYSFILFG